MSGWFPDTWDMVFAPIGANEGFEAALGDGLTAQDWITAGITFVGFVVLGRVLRRVVHRVVAKTDTEGSIARICGSIVGNLLTLMGIMYALSLLDVQIGPLLGALGVSGIAVAIAMTAILENVFASVVLKTRRPIRVGDEVTTHDHQGTVEEINFRSVVLRNFDGEKVVVPSSEVNEAPVVNHTDRTRRRTVLPIGVAYGTDLRLAQRVLIEAAQTVNGVDEMPPVQAWVTSFGSSSIDFDLRFWHASDLATKFQVRSDVAMAAKRAFDREGIEIPFPQRVVTMVRDDEGAEGAEDAGGAHAHG